MKSSIRNEEFDTRFYLYRISGNERGITESWRFGVGMLVQKGPGDADCLEGGAGGLQTGSQIQRKPAHLVCLLLGVK